MEKKGEYLCPVSSAVTTEKDQHFCEIINNHSLAVLQKVCNYTPKKKLKNKVPCAFLYLTHMDPAVTEFLYP